MPGAATRRSCRRAFRATCRPTTGATTTEAVSHLDEQLGRVLEALRETGLAERTVVVLLGDNGYMMGERGIGGPGSRANGKQVPYESSLRVPFVLSGPGLPRALASDLPVSSLDLPPTLLSLAGLRAPESWPGRDLTAALAGKIEIREAFSEWSDEKSETFGRLAYRVVRTPAHKLIVWKDPARGEELYDLAADPAEAAQPRRRACRDRRCCATCAPASPPGWSVTKTPPSPGAPSPEEGRLFRHSLCKCDPRIG